MIILLALLYLNISWQNLFPCSELLTWKTTPEEKTKSESQAWEGRKTPLPVWRWRWSREKECRWPPEIESGLWWQAAQETGTSVLQPQQMHSARNCSEIGRRTWTPADTRISAAQKTLTREPSQFRPDSWLTELWDKHILPQGRKNQGSKQVDCGEA